YTTLFRSKPGHDIGPAVEQLAIGDPVFERRNHRGAEVLVEHLPEIDAGVLADVLLDLGAHDRLVTEGLVQAAQDAAPPLVVIHDLPDRVQHVPALRVHVARSLGVHAVVRRNDGPIVANALAGADGVARAGLPAEEALGVDALRVV